MLCMLRMHHDYLSLKRRDLSAPPLRLSAPVPMLSAPPHQKISTPAGDISTLPIQLSAPVIPFSTLAEKKISTPAPRNKCISTYRNHRIQMFRFATSNLSDSRSAYEITI